jgi:hypothetical protein
MSPTHYAAALERVITELTLHCELYPLDLTPNHQGDSMDDQSEAEIEELAANVLDIFFDARVEIEESSNDSDF